MPKGKKPKLTELALDKHFSLLIRARDSWTCTRCRAEFARGTAVLQCSHLISRNNRCLRWHPLNAVAHCASCHGFLGGRPLDFAEWIHQHLGEERVNQLRYLARFKIHWTPARKKQLWQELLVHRAAMLASEAGGPEWFGFRVVTVDNLIQEAIRLQDFALDEDAGEE